MKVFPSTVSDLFIGKMADGLSGVLEAAKASSAVLIADDHTYQYCVPLMENITGPMPCIVIPAGESNKTLESCQAIWSGLIAEEVERSTIVLNVGGGMICDLGGFAASCYQRGIRFGHIPTSLLAMADAAIGGKTGVNFQGFKNYLGRFEVPAFVWIDPVFLKTLPQTEITSGLAEIVKHAIIKGGPLWEVLVSTQHVTALDWQSILELNTPIKQHIVEKDPYEKGLRKTLNFGHTIGHALESHFLHKGQPISHGKAVTLGMLAETKISLLKGIIGKEDFEAIIRLITRFLDTSEVTLPRVEQLEHWLKGDKKKIVGQVGFSLPDRVGSCLWEIPVEVQHLEESLNWLSIQGRA